jgi:hypothetical protein
MHLNVFFWEEIYKFHQNLKMVPGTKMVKNSWTKTISQTQAAT